MSIIDSPPWVNDLLACAYSRDGRLYRTVGIITDPAVIVEDVETGDRFNLVIGSRLYERYTKLSPSSPTPHEGEATAAHRADRIALNEYGQREAIE